MASLPLPNVITITPSDVLLKPMKPYVITGVKKFNVGDYYKVEKVTVLIVKADANNTGVVKLGDIAQQEFVLDAGGSVVFNCVDPRDIYVDVPTTGDKVYLWAWSKVE